MEKKINAGVPVVEVKDLVKRYRELVAVDHVSLTVNQGEIFGLLGPNGSGKTTLLHSVLALLKIDHGEIKLFGKPMTPTSYELKRRIGLIPQDVSVYNELSVAENIDYFCSLYVPDKAKRKPLVEEAISFVSLGEFRKFRPKQLSGGMLRRLNLACGIAHKPELIILDEPTVAVDPQSRNRILEGIKALRDQGATVIYTTHYMEEAEFLCDRIAIMDRGKILVEGSSEEILRMSSLGETIRMTIIGLDKDVLEAFRRMPEVAAAEYKDNVLSLAMHGGSSRLMTVLHELEKRGIEPIDVEGRRPTLNDVFLEITGKELRDNA